MRGLSISAFAIIALLSGCNDPESKKDPCLNAKAPEPIENLSKVLSVGANRPLAASDMFSNFGGKGVCLRSLKITGEPTTIQASTNAGASGITLLGEKVGLMTRLAVAAAAGGSAAADAANRAGASNAATTDTVGVTATNCCGLSSTATVQVNLKPPAAPAPGSSTTVMTLSADAPPPSDSIVFAPPISTNVTASEPTARGFGSGHF